MGLKSQQNINQMIKRLITDLNLPSIKGGKLEWPISVLQVPLKILNLAPSASIENSGTLDQIISLGSQQKRS